MLNVGETNEHCATTVKSKQSINILVVHFFTSYVFLSFLSSHSEGAKNKKNDIQTNETQPKTKTKKNESSLTCRFGHSKAIKDSSWIFYAIIFFSNFSLMLNTQYDTPETYVTNLQDLNTRLRGSISGILCAFDGIRTQLETAIRVDKWLIEIVEVSIDERKREKTKSAVNEFVND